MTLKSGYVSEARIKRGLAIIVEADTCFGDFPGLCRLARETLTYIVRLEEKVAEYEEKENKS